MLIPSIFPALPDASSIVQLPYSSLYEVCFSCGFFFYRGEAGQRQEISRYTKIPLKCHSPKSSDRQSRNLFKFSLLINSLLFNLSHMLFWCDFYTILLNLLVIHTSLLSAPSVHKSFCFFFVHFPNERVTIIFNFPPIHW